MQYNKNVFKHGKNLQYIEIISKLIYRIAVWESLKNVQ